MLFQGSWFQTGAAINNGSGLNFEGDRLKASLAEKTLERVLIAPAAQNG
jgi:hypothetical protein